MREKTTTKSLGRNAEVGSVSREEPGCPGWLNSGPLEFGCGKDHQKNQEIERTKGGQFPLMMGKDAGTESHLTRGRVGWGENRRT